MSNIRPVTAATQARVLSEFFHHGAPANRPAVDSDVLRQAVAPVTQKPPVEIRRSK